jgi:hypothetical protein
VRNIQGTLVPCSAKHFAVIINSDRTQEKPLDIEGYQVLNTEWGLDRVRPQKGKAIYPG